MPFGEEELEPERGKKCQGSKEMREMKKEMSRRRGFLDK